MNKASGGDGIPVELFQILKDDVQANVENTAVATGLEERQPQRKAMAKNAQTYHTTAFISHTNKVMLKILQARLQASM